MCRFVLASFATLETLAIPCQDHTCETVSTHAQSRMISWSTRGRRAPNNDLTTFKVFLKNTVLDADLAYSINCYFIFCPVHNPEVTGSNPVPATRRNHRLQRWFLFYPKSAKPQNRPAWSTRHSDRFPQHKLGLPGKVDKRLESLQQSGANMTSKHKTYDPAFTSNSLQPQATPSKAPQKTGHWFWLQHPDPLAGRRKGQPPIASNKPSPALRTSNPSIQALEEENQRLRRENEVLRQEREILKSAVKFVTHCVHCTTHKNQIRNGFPT
jgi:hypothetical protein